MDHDDIDASKAPLLDHLIELRQRLLWSFAAICVAFIGCFAFADEIYNILLYPYELAAKGNDQIKLIYTKPHGFLFTQLNVALFGAIFLAFPVLAAQIYMFVAPGLYKNEKKAFIPYLVATPILFVAGALLVYFVIMPLAMQYFLSMQQSPGEGRANIELLADVGEYLSLIMILMLAFGLCFQLPVILTLLARIGLVTSEGLKAKWKYAVIGIFAVAAFLTPPDLISQIGLGVPTLLLYGISIYCVKLVERRHAQTLDDENVEEAAS